MDPIAPPKPALDLALQTQPKPAEPSLAAQAAERRFAEHAAEVRTALSPDRLEVRLDESAHRFVQTLTDANTAETLRRYPSEAQLAYSRAVMAYLRASQS